MRRLVCGPVASTRLREVALREPLNHPHRPEAATVNDVFLFGVAVIQ